MSIVKPTQDSMFQSAIGQLQDSTGQTFSQGELVYELLRAIAGYGSATTEYTVYENRLNYWIERLTSDELDFIGGTVSRPRIQATQSNGNVLIQGDVGSQIPSGSLFTTSTNNYYSTGNYEIIENSSNITSVSRTGTVATVILSSDENLPTGAIVSISGFSETNFNVSNVVITALDTNSFSYTVLDTGDTSDSNGSCNYNGIFVPVKSEVYGLNTEVLGSFSLSNSLSLTSLVNFEGITGGSDVETDSDYLLRIKDKINNNTPKDSRSKIINTIKEEFPQITVGKIISNYNPDQITISSIEKISGEPNDNVRLVTTIEPHNLVRGREFKSITGSVHSTLNIDEYYSYNRFIGIVYSPYSFAIVVNDTTNEDTTSTMYLQDNNYQYCTIALYKSKSLIKTLTTQEINDITQFIKDSCLFTIDEKNFKIISAITQAVSINIQLTPNIVSLKNIIKNNLVDYVNSVATIGNSIKKSQIENIIFNSVDQNSRTVEDFTTNMSTDWTPNTEYKIISLTSANITFS